MTTSKLFASSQKNILDLNDEAIMAILSYLSYDEVAKLRLVCRKFNKVCMMQLNGGFASVKRYTIRCLMEVKAKLPHRPSQRLIHPLAEHFDILYGIKCQVQVLSDQYCIENDSQDTEYFYFFPGKILDECYRIIRELMNSRPNNNVLPETTAYDVLQEFQDLCEMAEEHFEEHILPEIERKQKLESYDNSFQDDSDSSLAMSVVSFSTDALLPVDRVENEFHGSCFQGDGRSSLTMDTPSFFDATFHVSTAIGKAIYSSISSMMSSLSSGLVFFSSASQQSGLFLTSRSTDQQEKEMGELKAKTSELERKLLEQDKLLTRLIEDVRVLKQTAPDVSTNIATEPQVKQPSVDYDDGASMNGDKESNDGAV